MSKALIQLNAELAQKLLKAAQDRDPVNGWTHNFYRYPARFSPRFAAAAIECFSKPGDLVLDPYMGGGTTVVEALVSGRQVVGNDLNSLATFIAGVKTTELDRHEVRAVASWADEVVPTLSYRAHGQMLARHLDDQKTRNLNLMRGRFIKKAIATALASIGELPTAHAQEFARCALLRVGQRALDGRRRQTSLREFRSMLTNVTHEMLKALREYSSHVAGQYTHDHTRILSQLDACEIHTIPIFSRVKASLVVTSPPYPGVHVLYHRWQVDGRRETPAPYWIAACTDGQGASFYNFGSRREAGLRSYFRSSLRTLKSIRRTMRLHAYIVQIIAFSDPKRQLPRYLRNMSEAGFDEVPPLGWRSNGAANRIWRQVPGRRWHAALKGDISSSREVVLIHQAI